MGIFMEKISQERFAWLVPICSTGTLAILMLPEPPLKMECSRREISAFCTMVKFIFLAESPQAIAAHLETIRSRRAQLFASRFQIAATVDQYRLDDWFREVLQLASDVASEGRELAWINSSP